MPDMTMCDGHGCPLKDKCYRYTAFASSYQSWFLQAPINEDGTCDYFWNDEWKEKMKAKDV